MPKIQVLNSYLIAMQLLSGYKLAQVPKAFRELRRISLAGNMLSDHMSKSYYEALLECKSIRRAPQQLPRWTGFDEESTW